MISPDLIEQIRDAADIVALKNEVQKAVLERFGTELQPEPVFVGFEAG